MVFWSLITLPSFWSCFEIVWSILYHFCIFVLILYSWWTEKIILKSSPEGAHLHNFRWSCEDGGYINISSCSIDLIIPFYVEVFLFLFFKCVPILNCICLCHGWEAENFPEWWHKNKYILNSLLINGSWNKYFAIFFQQALIIKYIQHSLWNSKFGYDY